MKIKSVYNAIFWKDFILKTHQIVLNVPLHASNVMAQVIKIVLFVKTNYTFGQIINVNHAQRLDTL